MLLDFALEKETSSHSSLLSRKKENGNRLQSSPANWRHYQWRVNVFVFHQHMVFFRLDSRGDLRCISGNTNSQTGDVVRGGRGGASIVRPTLISKRDVKGHELSIEYNTHVWQHLVGSGIDYKQEYIKIGYAPFLLDRGKTVLCFCLINVQQLRLRLVESDLLLLYRIPCVYIVLKENNRERRRIAKTKTGYKQEDIIQLIFSSHQATIGFLDLGYIHHIIILLNFSFRSTLLRILD